MDFILGSSNFKVTLVEDLGKSKLCENASLVRFSCQILLNGPLLIHISTFYFGVAKFLFG